MVAEVWRAKIWIERAGVKVFGDGPFDILSRVRRTGSLRQAAAEIKMSYSQAWRLIRMIEKNLGYPLLEKRTGGASGGYSKLTAKASTLVSAYSHFRGEAGQTLDILFAAHLATLLKEDPANQDSRNSKLP